MLPAEAVFANSLLGDAMPVFAIGDSLVSSDWLNFQTLPGDNRTLVYYEGDYSEVEPAVANAVVVSRDTDGLPSLVTLRDGSSISWAATPPPPTPPAGCKSYPVSGVNASFSQPSAYEVCARMTGNPGGECGSAKAVHKTDSGWAIGHSSDIVVNNDQFWICTSPSTQSGGVQATATRAMGPLATPRPTETYEPTGTPTSMFPRYDLTPFPTPWGGEIPDMSGDIVGWVFTISAAVGAVSVLVGAIFAVLSSRHSTVNPPPTAGPDEELLDENLDPDGDGDGHGKGVTLEDLSRMKELHWGEADSPDLRSKL